VFHTPHDAFVFCEAACRTGGAGVSPVFKELTGIDLNKVRALIPCVVIPLQLLLRSGWEVG
jgi:hypothetical protein